MPIFPRVPHLMMVPNSTIIVAATRSNGIGVSSRGLPWQLPLEMAYFARVTSRAPQGSINAVIMGRKCWESIPSKFRPLKNRINIVISGQPSYDLGTGSDNAVLAHSLDESWKKIESLTSNSESKTRSVNQVFIIGGASIYQQALTLPTLSRILLTRVLEPAFDDCDVHFPEFRDHLLASGEKTWKHNTHQDLVDWVGSDVPEGIQNEKGVEYEFQMWTRR